MRLNVLAFALTCGLLWGGGVLVLSWWVILLDGAGSEPGLLGRVYRGYALTPIGSLIGLAWALVDGFVGGAIFAWLYNALATRLGRRAGAS